MTNPAIQINVRAVAMEFGVNVDDILGSEPKWELGETYPRDRIELVIDAACKLKNISDHEFWKELRETAFRKWSGLRSYLTNLALEESREINQASLPDDPSLAKIQRYEAHLSRQFYRALHELQRLQAARRGFRHPVPLAVDIEVNSDP